MKKSKLIIGLSAFTLAIGGFLVTKANKKFNSVSTGAFVNTGGSLIATAINMASGFTTTASGKRLVKLVQTAGASTYTVIATLYTSASTLSRKVYH